KEIDAGAGAHGVLALHQVGDSAGELDDFDAALNITARVGDGLPVLGGEQLCQTLGFVADQLEKLEQNPGATLRIGSGPAGLRGRGGTDGGLRLPARCERDLRLHLAGIRIEDVSKAGRAPFDLLAVDKMANMTHQLSP